MSSVQMASHDFRPSFLQFEITVYTYYIISNCVSALHEHCWNPSLAPMLFSGPLLAARAASVGKDLVRDG